MIDDKDCIFSKSINSLEKIEVTSSHIQESLDDDLSVYIKKPSGAERLKRSIAARFRSKIAKFAKFAHLKKEEDEAVKRLQAKILLEKQKKRKNKVDNHSESV